MSGSGVIGGVIQRTGTVVNISFAAAVLLLLWLGFTVHQAASQAREASESVARTRDVLQRLSDVHVHFALIESAQWRFLLWGRGADLQERESAAERFHAAIDEVKQLTAGSTEQHQRSRQIEDLATQRIGMARELAQRRAREGIAQPWPAELSAAARETGRQVYRLTDAMRAYELSRLEENLKEEQRRQEQTLSMLALALIVSVVVLVPAYGAAAHQARRRGEVERRMGDVLEHLPVTAWQIRSEPGGQRRFVFIGGSVERLRGFTAEAAGRDINVVLSSIVDEDRPGVVAVMDAAERTLKAFDERYRVRLPDGSQRWIHSSAALRREADGVIIWNGYWADITVQKGLEQALEASNRELEAFSYSVSHDLRAPLAAIDGFSRELWERTHAQLDERCRHFLTRIRAGARQMNELVDGLLALAQVSRTAVLRQEVDLSELAARAADELREREPGRVVTLEVKPGMRAQGDARLLRQVYVNLLGNAWKFSGATPGARVDVGSQAAQDSQVVYFVRDNGVGFDMATAPKLFGAFQRYHSPSEYPGTGIGLATVDRIVSRHGGRVWAESAVGQGATVFFTLPDTPLRFVQQYEPRTKS